MRAHEPKLKEFSCSEVDTNVTDEDTKNHLHFGYHIRKRCCQRTLEANWKVSISVSYERF